MIAVDGLFQGSLLPHLWAFIYTNEPTLGKTATTHQITTMLATSKIVLFPGHDHLLTTSTDDLHSLALEW